MEQLHHHQWDLQEQEEEEEEQELLRDAALISRHKSIQHKKDGIILINGSNHIINGVCLEEEQLLTQKEEEKVEEIAIGVVENGTHFDEFADGEAIIYSTTAAMRNNNSVYFDIQQGMWKCHHCSWTRLLHSARNNNIPLWNVKLKTVVHHVCFVPETEESTGEGETDLQSEESEMQKSLCNKINNQSMKTIDETVPSSSSEVVQARIVENFDDASSTEAAGPNMTKEIDQVVEEELDVETVLAKQETHDLFCPNCNSCITKRVILKKRKRSLKNNLHTEAKRDKLDTKVVNSSSATSDAETIEPTANNFETEREPELFRCLSCFSFFIPLRNGIKLFPNSGGAHGPETSQDFSIKPTTKLEDPSIMAASKRSWFFSLFASNERDKSREQEQGGSSVENSRTADPEGQHSDEAIIVESVKIESETGSSSMNSSAQNYPKSLLQNNGLSSIESGTRNSNDVMNGVAKEQAMNGTEVQSAALLANDVASDTKIDAKFPSALDFVKVKKVVEEETSLSVEKEEKEAFKSSTSPIVDNFANNGDIGTETDTQIYIGEEPRAVTAETRKWEIIKSIVYGGLIESITSLGVVLSAASSGAAPLNIIALGLANLIGGLFIIGHDLINLKNGHSEEDSQQVSMQDRNQEELGGRENFLLHVVVAVLSFLIFGSVPLIVYGLLIPKDYYAEEIKLAAVLVTSIACIILLAIGKNYTRKPPKSYIKTVLHYVTLAVATSGVSYVVGNLIKHLLEKLSGPSDSVVVLTMPLSSTKSVESSWMSY